MTSGVDDTLDPGELLCTSRDRQVGLRVPVAVSQRVDALLARARAAGERTDRKELITALLAETDLSGDQLGDLLRRYRRMTVAHALLDQSADGSVVRLARARPGPRPRAS